MDNLEKLKLPKEQFRECPEWPGLMVSQFGRVWRKDIKRTYMSSNRGGPYLRTQVFPGRFLRPRTNGIEPHFFVDYHTRNEKGEKKQKTLYVHKLVAMTWVEKPHPSFNKVTFKDRNPENFHYSNIMWVDQSYLSARTMREHPEQRTRLKAHNEKNGYHGRRGLPEETITKINDLLATGLKLREVADELGISLYSVHKYNKTTKSLKEVETHVVQRFKNDGKTVKEISILTGLAYPKVRRIFNKLK